MHSNPHVLLNHPLVLLFIDVIMDIKIFSVYCIDPGHYTVQRKIFAGCIFREFIIRWISRKENSRIGYAQEATPLINIKPGSTLSIQATP